MRVVTILLSVLYYLVVGFRVFVETSLFKNKVDQLGGLDVLRIIQHEILKDPAHGDLIRGAGGIRKIRVAKKGSGKSGGYRVFYLNVPEQETIYLMAILDKREAENISAEEKSQLREFAKKLKGEK